MPLTFVWIIIQAMPALSGTTLANGTGGLVRSDNRALALKRAFDPSLISEKISRYALRGASCGTLSLIGFF